MKLAREIILYINNDIPPPTKRSSMKKDDYDKRLHNLVEMSKDTMQLNIDMDFPIVADEIVDEIISMYISRGETIPSEMREQAILMIQDIIDTLPVT